MAKLTSKARQKLSSSQFALPGRGEGKGGKGSGSYPIPDKSHARNALARASGKPIAGKVRAAVHRKYPDIGGKQFGGVAPKMPKITPLQTPKMPKVSLGIKVPSRLSSSAGMKHGGVATCGNMKNHGGFAELGIGK